MLRRAIACATMWTAFACAAYGCSDSKSGETPPPLSTATPPPRDAASDTAAPVAVDASPVDAGPMSRRFLGSLSAAMPVEFGGGQYCKYRVTLKQIDVDVTVTKEGNLANASVTNLALEEQLPPCAAGGIPPNIHKYTLASSFKLPSGAQHLVLAPEPDNQPKADLVLEGNFDTDKVYAGLEWHRNDLGPPFDWRVTATVVLDKRATQ